ncbi:hypothetical protein KY290_034204 [Solanum tuberosum]|uniref:Uncharacterized protein n=1 Tax=Solanum tuberosum TaxID=4113 RepID=A0ABQ7U2M6_SOLTU|nr:hypothetical protein KY289_033588 [Solanum tuberosum]KAH0648238.1 hypothetical protein KY285_033486 [Solanum tuberosum]KAH0741161.1 hypothetical protein KY290_034204 [Solanum tuberosum]
MASVFVKYREGDALVADKRNFKGKSRDMLHSRSSGHIRIYCRAKESNMAQKVAKEKEDWKNCLVAEARTIDVMVSINLEEDLIEDSEYNAVDHVEKKNVDVISMKQETIKDVHTGDMVASIEQIKEINSEQAVSDRTF